MTHHHPSPTVGGANKVTIYDDQTISFVQTHTNYNANCLVVAPTALQQMSWSGAIFWACHHISG